jgi:hypothetical protein
MDSIPGTPRTNTTNHRFRLEAHSCRGTDRPAHRKNTNPDRRPTTNLSDRCDVRVAIDHRANVPNRSHETHHAKSAGWEEPMCRSYEDGHGPLARYDRSHATRGCRCVQAAGPCRAVLQNHANANCRDLAAFRLSCPGDVGRKPDLLVKRPPRLQRIHVWRTSRAFPLKSEELRDRRTAFLDAAQTMTLLETIAGPISENRGPKPPIQLHAPRFDMDQIEQREDVH